jgi:hypothetical protein
MSELHQQDKREGWLSCGLRDYLYGIELPTSLMCAANTGEG